MDHVGLFPLSIVLMPTERVPLHVFENRYRELINGCLADDVPFGMVFVAARQTHDIGTYARVVEVLERFEDGRLNVVVEGTERFEVLKTMSERSYFTAEVTIYSDEAPPVEAEVRDAFIEEYLEAAEHVGAEPQAVDPDDPFLSFRVAAHLGLALTDKQELLEMRSEADRLNRLSSLLPEAMKTARTLQVRRRAATNGHAKGIGDLAEQPPE